MDQPAARPRNARDRRLPLLSQNSFGSGRRALPFGCREAIAAQQPSPVQPRQVVAHAPQPAASQAAAQASQAAAQASQAAAQSARA
jgi:hypothetical protein